MNELQSPSADADSQTDLESLLARINQLAGKEVTTSSVTPPSPSTSAPDTASAPIPPTSNEGGNEEVLPSSRPGAAPSVNSSPPVEDGRNDWKPLEPDTLDAAGVSEGQLEHLVLKALAACGDISGRGIAEQHALPFRLVEPVLQDMKTAQLVAFRGSAPMNDYIYQPTDMGRERAKKLTETCSYFGAAPVTLEAYIDSVKQQSIAKLHPTETDLKRAFSDLLINPDMLRRLGPAVNSGRGLFLYGMPGNGKTSIAERVTSAFGDCIWVPRSIGIDGEIMRVFDPGLHEEAPLEHTSGPLNDQAVDLRWVRIRRPTIVVGGELTMNELEVKASSGSNVSEASIQLKSNCGTLVIDDFGRQRMTTDELLNRWIVPLEKRYDFLQCVNGKKIQVPFDQLIIFSTNLEPKDLVDDAFLRRIPYKIEVGDPSEEEFRKLFEIMAPIVGIPYDAECVNYLVEDHYKKMNRPFRCCQPRDLLLQVVNYCRYIDKQPQMSHEYIDYAVENYFAIM
ncbi:ATP-binding protein [Adhaeretor mobilis]|uniref:AAA+ ATPase domain-containing protein n=1 Tax=Adhaeretor mobilis TaxID=1930276 RepID=A0A517MUJ7_9BACT|nr:AAA family ATPase [Adhaeretor mobilis]QDS98565.1 hypothetical protein HG15A2_18460 [Adhaeretor mobilis]